MSDENIPALVGRAPCGCAQACYVADPADVELCQDAYAESRKWQKAGWTVETRTVGWVRAGGLNFDCPHGKGRKKRSKATGR